MKRIISIIICLAFLCVGAAAGETLGNTNETGGKEIRDPVRLPIVMYHQMTKSPDKVGQFTVLAEQFDSDLEYLKSAGYESITVRQLLEWYDGMDTLPEKPMMVTFDDGYETTLEYAQPILKKHGCTAVVAVVGAIADWYTETEDHNLNYSHLSWKDVRKMSESPEYEIQCHTFDMHKLEARCGCDKINSESTENYTAALTADIKEYEFKCAENGVNSLKTVAYPYGYFCEDTINIFQGLGYRLGFTCVEKVNIIDGSPEDMLVLGRYNREPGKSSQEFFSKWDEH